MKKYLRIFFNTKIIFKVNFHAHTCHELHYPRSSHFSLATTAQSLIESCKPRIQSSRIPELKEKTVTTCSPLISRNLIFLFTSFHYQQFLTNFPSFFSSLLPSTKATTIPKMQVSGAISDVLVVLPSSSSLRLSEFRPLHAHDAKNFLSGRFLKVSFS